MTLYKGDDMEKKFFLVFDMHSNTEKKFWKMGIVKHENRSGFSYDGSDWVEIEPSDFYGVFVFSRNPAPAFDELWNLFIYSKDKGNRIGAICYILQYHYIRYRTERESLKSITPKDRAVKKALKTLRELYSFLMSDK